MKHLKLILLVVLPLCGYAQSSSLAISVGQPWFADKDVNTQNISTGLSFYHKLNESFACEALYEYGYSNNMPVFLNETGALSEFMFSQTSSTILQASMWSMVQYQRLGAAMHYQFVNNQSFVFSCFLGSGYLVSESSGYVLELFEYNINTGQITDFDGRIDTQTIDKFYYNLGFQFHVNLSRRFFLGLNTSFLQVYDDYESLQNPVNAGNYNLSLLFGKRFDL